MLGELVFCTNAKQPPQLISYRNSEEIINKMELNGSTDTNGHGICLHDVERLVCMNLEDGDGIQVVAEHVIPLESDTPILLAFLKLPEALEASEDAPQVEVQTITTGLNERLAMQLSPEMIPYAYILVDNIPMTATGIPDRKKLCEIGENMTLEQLDALNEPEEDVWREPSTPMEHRLQGLWAEILDVDAEEIGADDNFLRIGGDSIEAMRLVGAAYKQGLSFAVADVFQQPRLSDLAKIVIELPSEESSISEESRISPFSLLKPGSDLEMVREQAAVLCGVEASQIEDAFPCTPLQEGLLALTAKESGNYVARRILELRVGIDVERLMRAWEEVVKTTPILRTRIVDIVGQGLTQVVVEEPAHWGEARDSINRSMYEKADKQFTMGLGTRLVRYGLVDESEHNGKRFFMLTMHHSTYDGWSMTHMAERLRQAYDGVELEPLPPFQGLVKHIMDTEKSEAESFWKSQFDDLEAQAFPATQSSTHEPRTDTLSNYHIRGLQWPKSEVTPSATVRAAWSLVAASYTNANDVVFGVTVTGRQAALNDIQRVMGPTLATVPVRVVLDREKTIADLQQQIQSQSIEMTAFEQTGLQQIRKASSEAKQACDFQTLLVIQPPTPTTARWGGLFVEKDGAENEEGNDIRLRFYSYAITIECKLEDEGLELRVGFDSLVIDGKQVEKLISQLEHVLQLMCEPKNHQKRLRDVETITPQDLQDIWSWNSTVPESVDACVHDLIGEVIQRQPEAPAVCAWDGDWSYRELDEISTQLAHRLVDLDVGPEVIVPLCIEKSRWTPVAMLAVMKAGGAPVFMDSTQPEERLHVIVQQVQETQTKPVLVLASSTNQVLASRLTEGTVLVVNKTHEAPLDGTTRQLPTVRPWNRLYVAFTSGSTGTPKGAIIKHSNFSSAIRYQQGVRGFAPTSRVFDFASYAFDVSWSNVLHTLTSGACLCIPSEDDRREDLAGSMLRFGATLASLTPSTASVLPDSTLKSLKHLILSGENIVLEDAKRWAAFSTVVNSYGPCECTPHATMDVVDAEQTTPASIGKGFGVNTWIVRPSDHNYLAAVGSIGELLLEGPTVGAGYLGDTKRSAETFIEDPEWLVQGSPGHPGRHGRLYKTGDLVRYNSDGALVFIGRKDAQVKINGQRVELGEIESHILRHLSTRQSSTLFPESGPFAKRLIGIFSMNEINTNGEDRSVISLTPEHNAKQTRQHAESLQALLDDALPSYMIPSVWISLIDIPLNASGKVDKKRLQMWLSDMDSGTLAKIIQMNRRSDPQKPTNDAEQALCDACAVILSVPADNIDLRRSFIANGGDSISAMRLSSYCRSAGVVLTVAVLLRSKSLVEVAKASKAKAAVVTFQKEDFGKLFDLSPMQQWFMARSYPENVNQKDHFANQGFYVAVKREVSPTEMCSAVSTIVQRHSMFRARFQRNDSKWAQRVLPPVDGLYHFGSSRVASLTEVTTRTTQMHQELDIEQGPVFAAELYTLPSGSQYLIMIAHHLVVDLVSWRIVLDDLQTILNGGTLIEPGLSFQVWCQLQLEKAESVELDPQNVLASKAGIKNNLDFWEFSEGSSNTSNDHIKQTTISDQQITLQLLQDANRAFNTEPVDIILSAIWNAFFKVFPERGDLTIFNEGHGREPWTEDIDLSNTIGWFTTICPLHATKKMGSSPADIVRLVKDMRRRLPANGWAYFTSRFLNTKGIKEFQDHNSTMELVFNYHGQYQQLEHEGALFSKINLEGVSASGSARSLTSLLNINAFISGGVTQFNFSWNQHIAYQDRISKWIDQIDASLAIICKDLCARKPSSTICDYEFLNLDYDYNGLEELQRQVIPLVESTNASAVEEIYPCWPMVDGMLLSQIQRPESYKNSQTYVIKPCKLEEKIDLDNLAEAWQSVIARHTSLRSVFVSGMDATAAFNQIVLKSYRGEVVLLQSENKTSALAMMEQLPHVDYQQLKPPHRLALCQVMNSDEVICKLEISHAVTDGASRAIIQHDWSRAYAGALDTTELEDTTSNFVRALKATPAADKMEYWMKKLTGMTPCYFPALSDSAQYAVHSGTGFSRAKIDLDCTLFAKIQQFCENQSVTPSSLFQSAWALTLAAYTSTDSVCFGYLASGRDLPIQGITESIGAYANMLICRAEILRDSTSGELIRSVYEQVLEDLSFQHCSLADIQHELNVPPGQGLFNTIMSFTAQHEDSDRTESTDDEKQGFIFVSRQASNLTEVSVPLQFLKTYQLTQK